MYWESSCKTCSCYDSEGYDRTTWLRQATEVLKRKSFDVIYVDVLHKEFVTYTDVKEVIERISEVVDLTGLALLKLAI